jgi:hypothetical protein
MLNLNIYIWKKAKHTSTKMEEKRENLRHEKTN